ncbi:hypothetical protein MY11210_003211 [Beauveria gryllotalpidicola]
MEDLVKYKFQSLKQAEDALRDVTRKDGYLLVTQNSKEKRITKVCTRFRALPTRQREGIVREGQSSGCLCRYRVFITQGRDGMWSVDRGRGTDDSRREHNHPPQPPESYAQYRRDDARTVESDIIFLSNLGERSQSIIDKLVAQGKLRVGAVSAQDVANIINQHRQRELDGQPPT